MATLAGHIPGGSSYVLELTPVLPTLEGPHYDYLLALTVDGDEAYRRQHRVRGWSSGLSHIYVYWIARAFQNATRLLDARVKVSYYGTEREYACITVGAEWVEFVLWGLNHKTLGRPLFHVQLYLQVQTGGEALLPSYVRANFICSPTAAEEFGHTLEDECDAAEQLREQLGIPRVPQDHP